MFGHSEAVNTDKFDAIFVIYCNNNYPSMLLGRHVKVH